MLQGYSCINVMSTNGTDLYMVCVSIHITLSYCMLCMSVHASTKLLHSLWVCPCYNQVIA